MSDMASKGCRVAGVFIAMLGAGVVLESAAPRLGVVVMIAGLALLGYGLAALRQSSLGEPRT